MLKNIRQLFMFNLNTLILFEIFYKLSTIFILGPLMMLLLHSVMQITGHPYLDLENIWSFLINPITIIFIIFAIIVLTACAMIDITAVIVITDCSKQKQKIDVWTACKISLQKCSHLVNRRNLLLPLVVLILIPFLNIGLAFGVNSSLVIPEFIVSFILHNLTLAILSAVLLVVLIIIILRWMYAFHYYVLENDDFKTARLHSQRLINKNTIKDTLLLIGFQILYSLVLLLVVAIGAGVIWLINQICGSWGQTTEVLTPILIVAISLVVALIALCTMPFVYTVISYRFYQHKKQRREKIQHIKIEESYRINQRNRRICLVATLSILLIGGTLFYTVGDGKYSVARSRPIEITAHRGFSSEYPENTMAAIRAAHEAGADWIEIDIQQTKDNQIVVSHDTNLKSRTGVDKEVWEMNYSDIAKLNFDGEKIPLFTEVLDYAAKNNVKLNIEIKTTGHEKDIEQKTIDLIRQYKLENQVMVASLKYDIVDKVHQLAPDLSTLYIMTLAFGNINNMDNISHYSIEASSISPELLYNAHSVGKKIHAWTVDDELMTEYLNNLGVDGIITNDPAHAREILADSERLDEWGNYFKLMQAIAQF